MSKLFRKIKFCEDCLLGGSTVRDEIQRAGNCNCGFLHCPKAFERQEYILLESGRAFLLMRV